MLCLFAIAHIIQNYNVTNPLVYHLRDSLGKAFTVHAGQFLISDDIYPGLDRDVIAVMCFGFLICLTVHVYSMFTHLKYRWQMAC